MRQNSKKKALIPALAMALASVIALSGVTYAWFTAGTSATVDTMDLDVLAADGIEVSLDASDWDSTITAEDRAASIAGQGNVAYAYSANTNQFPTTGIKPISTAGNLKATGKTDQMELFDGDYYENADFEYVLRATAKEDETSNGAYGDDYIAFDLFFNASKDMVVYLDATSAITEKMAEGQTLAYNTHLASRVAFIDMGAQTSAALSRADITPEVSTATIWEPNAKNHTYSAIDNGAVAGEVKAYDGVSAAGDDDTVGYTAVNTITEANNVEIALEQGVNKVRVYIWLEGQDIDCNNDISYGDFSTKLIFNKK